MTNFILSISPRGRYFRYPHYTDEKTKDREVKELPKGDIQLVRARAGLATHPGRGVPARSPCTHDHAALRVFCRDTRPTTQVLLAPMNTCSCV